MGLTPKMKLLLGVLGLALGAETSLSRSRRSTAKTCDEVKNMCNMDVSDGVYDNMAQCLEDSDVLGLCSGDDDDQCQNYQYDGFKLFAQMALMLITIGHVSEPPSSVVHVHLLQMNYVQ